MTSKPITQGQIAANSHCQVLISAPNKIFYDKKGRDNNLEHEFNKAIK